MNDKLKNNEKMTARWTFWTAVLGCITAIIVLITAWKNLPTNEAPLPKEELLKTESPKPERTEVTPDFCEILEKRKATYLEKINRGSEEERFVYQEFVKEIETLKTLSKCE